MKRLFVVYMNNDFDGSANSIAVSTTEVHSELYDCDMRAKGNGIYLSDPLGARIRIDLYFGEEDLEFLDVRAEGDPDLIKEHKNELEKLYRMSGFHVKKISELH